MSISLLTPAQVSEILGVSEKTLASWRVQKRGPAYIKTGKILYRPEDIEKYLDSKIIMPLCRSVCRNDKKARKCA